MSGVITGISETAFSDFVHSLVDVIGHADRAVPLKDYCLGLLLPVERKSVEPLAAVTSPSRVSSKHQSLLHFVGQAPWSDEALLARVRERVLPQIEQRGPIKAWIIDDTGFPKKGKHSVGVARQYCGQLGKQDNCQVAVSLSVANAAASLPIAYRLYLPETWCDDPERRRKVKVPEEIGFQTKPAIALDQVRTAKAAGVAPGVVLADSGYGADGSFRAGLTTLGLTYVVGVQPTLSVWRPGQAPLPPKPWSGRGRPPSLLQRNPDHAPISAKALARELPPEAWKTVCWREGTNVDLSSRFTALWLHLASRDYNLTEPRPEEWLLIEWPEGDEAPLKYWLATLPADTSLEDLVSIAKLRWRIERDYQELKQELGLGHYEGRGWRGFHHHASLCIAAYAFLVSQREAIPPSGPHIAKNLKKLGIPEGYRSRGSPDQAGTPRQGFDCDHPTMFDRSPKSLPPAMSILYTTNNN
ncbi:hypothetical protein ABENE_04845 [Asticcacaulis benevestitus DSM 16100 = ATCC BAA-896]|uniref:Transposase IS701-like DDE domain-containing protein n=1 Tax=Asticcacaulis benevestitus DSM 16100 = ATCC BAA-896 TaxID=1121022 RepID=V4PI75_9CAUL|nr:hypothetical protein ABENE_04845 [Asticcacaulis benevestitus DSM 16100 = ATCC BAA-896]